MLLMVVVIFELDMVVDVRNSAGAMDCEILMTAMLGIKMYALVVVVGNCLQHEKEK